MSRYLGIDLETKSSVDLKKCGVYRYVESPDFAILLLAYAWDDEEPVVIDLAMGETIIILGWGVVQVGMSIQSHDASQRTQGFLCLFGGLLIAFAKEILTAIGVV